MRWITYREGTPFRHWVTLDEASAIREYRRLHPDRDVSDFVALDGFMSRRNARFCADPETGVELKNYMAMFSRAAGGPERAARKLNTHPNVVMDVISGKRLKVPAYILKAVGLKLVVTVLPVDETA